MLPKAYIFFTQLQYRQKSFHKANAEFIESFQNSQKNVKISHYLFFIQEEKKYRKIFYFFFKDTKCI